MSDEDHFTEHPLSRAQARLWFMDRFAPDSPFYNVSNIWRLRGVVERRILQDSINLLRQRHPALRTVITARLGEQPLQRVLEYHPTDMSLIDVSRDLDPHGRAQQVVAAEVNRPFDLAVGPLFRSLLVSLSDDEHVLVLTLHHIVADAWSMSILARELTAAYSAAVRGEVAALSKPSMSYGRWSERELDGAGSEDSEQILFWRKYLDGASHTINLDRDWPVETPSFAGETLDFEIPAGIASGVRAVARAARATPFMAFLAAFYALLYHHSGDDDITIVSQLAGRAAPEVESIVGFFVKTLPFRVDLGRNPTFIELLLRVRDSALGVYANQDVTFEQLVQELGQARDRGRNPLSQVAFQMLLPRKTPLEMAGLTVDPEWPGYASAKFEISVMLFDSGGAGVGGRVTYGTDMYRSERIRAMCHRYVEVLRQIAMNPGIHLNDISAHAPEEIATLRDWMKSAPGVVSDETLVDLWTRQVEARGADRAIVYGPDGSTISFREIDEASDRVASMVRRLPLLEDEPVGISARRGWRIPAAILGIWKAGHPFLFVDREYPETRILQVLSTSGTRFVLSDDSSDWQIGGASYLAIDDACATSLGSDAGSRATHPEAHDLKVAYVSQTSGSTGTPKPVVATAKALSQFLLAAGRELDGDDVVLQLPRLTFEPAIRDLFVPLFAGRPVVFMADGDAADPRAMLRYISEYRVTKLLAVVPSVLESMLTVSRTWPTDVRLRAVYTCGEVLPAAIAREAASRFECRVFNQYGPTECSMVSTRSEASETSSGTVPLGRPAYGALVAVVDERCRFAPIGVTGQIVIGGDHLALGYLGFPEQTAEKFVPDGLTGTAGARLCLTGDFGRIDFDGQLEFRGRRDDQVKLRGFRVELQEVASVAALHPAVSSAVCTLHRGEGVSDPQVWLYYVGSNEVSVPHREIHAFLAGRLPRHCLPTVIQRLVQLPVGPSGKVDAGRLPVVGLTRIEDSEHVPPRSDVEIAMARVWGEVLGVSQVSVRDDFFLMGGHSLMAVQLVDRMESELGIVIPLRLIFDAPTIEELAQTIQAAP